MEMRGLEKWLPSTPVWAAFTRRVVAPRLWADSALPERAEAVRCCWPTLSFLPGWHAGFPG